MPTAAVIGGSVLGAISSRNASRRAADSQNKATQAALDQTNASTAQARADVNNIFPQAQERAQQGFQGALDIFRGSAPQQANLFQQGNVAAQNAILSGLPQIQNALLGGNVDLSQLQAFQAPQADFSFIPQNINPVQAQIDAQAPIVQPDVNIGGANQFDFNNLANLNNRFNFGSLLSGKFNNRVRP